MTVSEQYAEKYKNIRKTDSAEYLERLLICSRKYLEPRSLHLDSVTEAWTEKKFMEIGKILLQEGELDDANHLINWLGELKYRKVIYSFLFWMQENGKYGLLLREEVKDLVSNYFSSLFCEETEEDREIFKGLENDGI